MTPSIIRRFARYHGVCSAGHDSRKTTLELVSEVQAAIGYESGEAGRLMLVQSLTRIEDAEIAASFADSNDRGYALSQKVGAARIARKLFALAGIDETKWREVKE